MYQEGRAHSCRENDGSGAAACGCELSPLTPGWLVRAHSDEQRLEKRPAHSNRVQLLFWARLDRRERLIKTQKMPRKPACKRRAMDRSHYLISWQLLSYVCSFHARSLQPFEKADECETTDKSHWRRTAMRCDARPARRSARCGQTHDDHAGSLGARRKHVSRQLGLHACLSKYLLLVHSA